MSTLYATSEGFWVTPGTCPRRCHEELEVYGVPGGMAGGIGAERSHAVRAAGGDFGWPVLTSVPFCSRLSHVSRLTLAKAFRVSRISMTACLVSVSMSS